MMNPDSHHRIRSTIAGTTLGLIALVLVAALLGGALYAYRASRTIDNLSAQLTDARGQIDALRRDNEQLASQNRHLLSQNTKQHAQLDALILYLRRHGLTVPNVIFEPSPALTPEEEVTVANPKVPQSRPSHPPSPSVPGTPTLTPAPTPPTPSPGLGILCDLTPILCIR